MNFHALGLQQMIFATTTKSLTHKRLFLLRGNLMFEKKGKHFLKSLEKVLLICG
jgi:hypothetical protein